LNPKGVSRNVVRQALASDRPRESARARKCPVDVGCLWDMRTEVVAGQAFPLITLYSKSLMRWFLQVRDRHDH